MSNIHIREFKITDEIRQLGVSRICVAGKTLFVYNTRKEPIRCQYYRDDLCKTTSKLRKALNDFGEFGKETIDKFLVLLSQVWLASIEAEAKEAEIAQTRERSQRENMIEQIRQIKTANSGITRDEWIRVLNDKYENLRKVVGRNIPELWPGLEFELSVLRILNIYGCMLPFIGIILGRPSSSKTATISLLRKWYCTYIHT
ncbi:MAG: hypothetical protein WA323_13650 [Candidatus Nitrosopolaris sp.]